MAAGAIPVREAYRRGGGRGRIPSPLPPGQLGLTCVFHSVPDGGEHRDVVGPINVRGAVIPPKELAWRFSRSPGPGGQSVNTTDSRAEVSYDVASSTALGPVLRERALRALAGRLVDGVITVSASEHRSQLRNREAALRRLTALLTAATAPPPAARRRSRPTRSATERRLADKHRRSAIKRLRGGGEP